MPTRRGQEIGCGRSGADLGHEARADMADTGDRERDQDRQGSARRQRVLMFMACSANASRAPSTS